MDINLIMSALLGILGIILLVVVIILVIKIVLLINNVNRIIDAIKIKIEKTNDMFIEIGNAKGNISNILKVIKWSISGIISKKKEG